MTNPEPEVLIAPVAAAVADLLPDGVPVRSPATISHVLRRLAQQVYQQGRTDGLAELLTTEQAAARLGLSPARVRALAAARHVGWQVGRDWLFRPEDLTAMAARRPGRPRRGEE